MWREFLAIHAHEIEFAISNMSLDLYLVHISESIHQRLKQVIWYKILFNF